MGSKRLSGRQICLCLVLVSLAIFVYIYFVLYADMEKEAEEFKKESENVRYLIEQREASRKEQDIYLEKIDDIEQDMMAILERYPSELGYVDALMFLQCLEEQNRKVKILSATITDTSSFYQTTVPIRGNEASEIVEEVVEDVDILGNEENEEGIVVDDHYMNGMRCSISLMYQASYKDLKECMRYLKEYPSRVTLDNISMTYDESTRTVNGAMSISLYAIHGSGIPYERPEFPKVKIGKDNIFETID